MQTSLLIPILLSLRSNLGHKCYKVLFYTYKYSNLFFIHYHSIPADIQKDKLYFVQSLKVTVEYIQNICSFYAQQHQSSVIVVIQCRCMFGREVEEVDVCACWTYVMLLRFYLI